MIPISASDLAIGLLWRLSPPRLRRVGGRGPVHVGRGRRHPRHRSVADARRRSLRGPVHCREGARILTAVRFPGPAVFALRVLAGERKEVDAVWLKQFSAPTAMQQYLELLRVD